MIYRITVLLLILSCATSSFGENLVYMTENHPPANFEENGELKGISIEVLKLIWDELNIDEQPVKVLPWARGFKELQSKKSHMLFATTRNEAREKMFKWVGPIFSAENALIGLASNNVHINNLEDAKQYEIGTVLGDIGESSLLDAGFDEDKIQGVNRMELNIKKLLAGRVEFISHKTLALNEFCQRHDYKRDLFKTFYVINKKSLYFAFNNETPDEVIEEFQSALDKVKEKHTAILKKYNVEM